MTEFEFIRRFLSDQPRDESVILGIGDDAAIVRPNLGCDLHISSDMLLAGRHFFTDVAPADLAHKVLAVNISDMAAMGATPKWALLNMALESLDENWLHAFSGSLFKLLSEYQIQLIGGDTTKGEMVFSVTIIGEAPRGMCLRRSGAQLGDDIWVSGLLGSASLALQHRLGLLQLPPEVFAECEMALLRPQPRIALGRALLGVAHAAQDVSDGLAQDLGHILTASSKGAVLWADEVSVLPALRRLVAAGELSQSQLLQSCLAGGDDYELVFTAPVEARAAIMQAGLDSGTAVRRVGKINASGRLQIVTAAGEEWLLTKKGFDHFDETTTGV